jgi:translation initiation factor 2 subunit 2
METFEEMLDNLYANIECKKNNLKIVLPEPILIKNGKKTIWKNVTNYLKLFNREPNHFINFINTETSTNINWLTDKIIDGCIFTNKTSKDLVYEIMKKYIKEQILCKSCQSIDTYLEKNKELRKYNLICNSCKNEYII